MYTVQGGKFERTDIWREGKWLDLWSVVHLLSGVSVGFGLYFLHLGVFASVVIAFLAFVLYEMWEAIVKIEEEPTNRFMDVVVGMSGFLPAFFVAPMLSQILCILGFGLVLTANVVMSVFGWRASQKAAALERRMRERYAKERARLIHQKSKLSRRFRR
ncbi:MAG TPA: hypothetical protein VIJ88_02830 [Candidatus Paceibacterota bacterium]